jgi:hypothetical protein
MKEVYKKSLRRIGILILTLFSLAVLVLCVSFIFKALAAVSNLATLNYTNSPVRSIVLVLSIAFLAMALLQGLRSIVPFRGWFHARQVRRRFIITERDIDELKIKSNYRSELSALPYKVRAEEILKILLRLANATNETAFLTFQLSRCAAKSALLPNYY